MASGSGSTATTRAPLTCTGPSSPKCSSRRGHDLVFRPQVEAGEDDVAAVGRRAGERDLLRLGADEAGECDAGLLAQAEHPLEVLLAEAAVGEIGVELLLHRSGGRAGERAEGAGVQVGEPLEHREERPALLGRHPILISTGA